MNGLWFRSAAMSFALASCALAAGPGIAVARADFFGIDFFGHHDKSEMHHPRPGSDVSARTTRAAGGVAAAEAPTAKIGSAPESLVASQPATSRTAASDTATSRLATGIVEAVAAPRGGGAAPPATVPGRAPTLPRVSTAPSTRSVVIRRLPDSAAAIGSAPVTPRSPAAALAASAPELGESEGSPAPAGPPAPVPTFPRTRSPLATGSGEGRLPNSFRVGYAEYLRTADTSDLLVAALPGAAGIAGFTLVGAYAGYRQARAVQKALVAPAPTSILL